MEPQINIFNQKLCTFSVPRRKEREGWSEKGRKGGGIGKMGECTLYSVQCSEERERAGGGALEGTGKVEFKLFYCFS